MAKLPCPPELWPAFSALLDEALELPESDRRTWLEGLGSEHAAVRPWIERIITGTGLTREIGFMKGPAAGESTAEFRPGQHIGPYLLKNRLGSGGMGEVWLASRSDGALNRQVALKLPHIHLLAGTLRRRFERERDILAGLSHPHIAQLYDAGVADAEHPYLAMEWVDGVSINDHCRTAKLPLDGRLDLFLQVLEAVGYAHGRLIAHRDLKPSNILVTRDECVKLLDFGIAKLLVGDGETGATQLTRVGSCIATPAYAAPEQLLGEPVTASVDLYALGVILHELLTGQRPFNDKGIPPSQRLDPPRASSRVDTGYAESVGGLDARRLRHALAGDLDAIIAKALEVDPARRYRSAEVFAQDIELSRRHRPISARHIGPAAVAWKFVRRHRIGAAMSAGLLFALIGGSAGIAWQAVRAEREAQRATTIKDFLVGVFRASDPRIAEGKPRGEITARELLDISTQQIESGFAQQPDTKLELLGVAADIYRELDETRRSTALYSRETELARTYFGAADAHGIDGLLGQAFNADTDGDDERALALLSQADPLIHQAHLYNTAVRARWQFIRGEALMGDASKNPEARTLLENAAKLFNTVAPKDLLYPESLIELGNLALERSRFSEAAYYYRQAIAVTQRNKQADGDLLLENAGLALALEQLGDFDGAAAAFDQGTRIAAHTYGLDSAYYRGIASDWAKFRYERGERQAALAAFEVLAHNIPNDRAAFRNATDALEAAQVLRKYGHCLATDGQGALSIAFLERARTLLKTSTPRAIDAGLLQQDLGNAYEAGGRLDEARESFLASINTLEAQKAPAPQLARVRERWGRFLLSQHDINGAHAEFDKALRLSLDNASEPVIYSHAGLAAIALARGDVAAAVEYSRVAVDQLSHSEGYYDVRIQPYVWSVRARALLSAGDTAGARLFAERNANAAVRYYAPASAAIAEATDLFQRTARNPTNQR